MIDTIKITADVLYETAYKLQEWCFCRQGFDLSTGEMMYQITTGELQGSWDSRIGFRVDRIERFTHQVTIECSIHKVILGHNVYGGSNDLLSCVNYLVKLMGTLSGIELPPYYSWRLHGIDITNVYQLSCFEAVQDWFSGLGACDYSRRKVRKFGLESVGAYGSTSKVIFYHKGPEFWKHDYKRLSDIEWKYINANKQCPFNAKEILDIANRLVRVEVGIKSRKIKELFGCYPYVTDVNMALLLSMHDTEVKKFLKEGLNDMVIVRNKYDVKARLMEVFKKDLALKLLATWYELTISGEHEVKKTLMKNTYYRHLRQLKEAGVSWHGTDVVLKSTSLVPADFVPIPTDIRCMSAECPEMIEKLKEFRVA